MPDQSESSDESTDEQAPDAADEQAPEDDAPDLGDEISKRARKIETAGIDLKGDPDSLGDILEGAIDGDIPPEKIDDELREWITEEIEIPFIGEASESVLLRQIQKVLKSAVVSIVRRIK